MAQRIALFRVATMAGSGLSPLTVARIYVGLTSASTPHGLIEVGCVEQPPPRAASQHAAQSHRESDLEREFHRFRHRFY